MKGKSLVANTDSQLRLVIFGKGTSKNRTQKLLRLSDGLMKELEAVAQGPKALLVEVALRKLIDELKAKPRGAAPELIDAGSMLAQPASSEFNPKKSTDAPHVRHP